MSESSRPDPDSLLRDLKIAEARAGQGRLKIFLGMCPGVGKTYAMLLDAQQRQEDGQSVVIGVIETHGRIETQALTAGLARIPRRRVEHRGVVLEEMDLEAILQRRPDLVLVDELAHSNVAGGRHPKRWQDVSEILEAGIDVFTTLNVQHIESYREVVAQITGVPVHETVPDSLIDRADEVELIDIAPVQLRKRLEDGKVYLGERAALASDHFFREGNLKALREIALRVTADCADRELRAFLQSRRIAGPWKSRERFLVAVGPSPYSEPLIRWTRRIATLTHGNWLAAFIDTGRPLRGVDRERLERNLTLARSLGAEVLTATGADLTTTLLRVARENNITQIVVGKPLTSPFWDLLRGGSVVDRLLRRSGDIDIFVVQAEKNAARWRPELGGSVSAAGWREVGGALLLVAAVTALGLALKPLIGYMSVGLLYLLAVLLGSIRLARGPLLLAAAVSALTWNFLFITPRFTFAISNPQDLILFGFYFVLALVLGHFSARLRQREQAECRREEQATALYHFSRDLVRSVSQEEAIQAGVGHVEQLFGAAATVLTGPELVLRAGAAPSDRERAVAAWVYEKGRVAGRFTDTLPEAEAFFLPLRANERTLGVMGLRVSAPLTLAERQLLETFTAQLALVIERDGLRREAELARIEENSRRLQKTLLDCVSHEFKTPLAVISSATETLRVRQPADPLLAEICAAVRRLGRVVGSLLDMTRIESGLVRPRLEWCDLREIIEEAMTANRTEIGDGRVTVEVAEDVAMVRLDGALLAEMIGNLLRNAAQYGPVNGRIHLEAFRDRDDLVLTVADEGSGLPAELGERAFEKFHRGPSVPTGGLGLGLSVVRGFAEAHGGMVGLRAGGNGTVFEVRLPVAMQSTRVLE